MFYRHKILKLNNLFDKPITVDIKCKAKNLSNGYVEDLSDINDDILKHKYETYEILAHSIMQDIPTAVTVKVSDEDGNIVIYEENDK